MAVLPHGLARAVRRARGHHLRGVHRSRALPCHHPHRAHQHAAKLDFVTSAMRGFALAVAAFALLAGCTGEEADAAMKPAAPLTPPVELCRTKSHRSCRTAIEVEGW